MSVPNETPKPLLLQAPLLQMLVVLYALAGNHVFSRGAQCSARNNKLSIAYCTHRQPYWKARWYMCVSDLEVSWSPVRYVLCDELIQ